MNKKIIVIEPHLRICQEGEQGLKLGNNEFCQAGRVPNGQPAAAAPAAAPAAAQNGSGTADYSAQWAEYYRSIGKIKEAEAIEQQMKSKVS